MTPVQTLPGGDPTTFHSTWERMDTLLTFAGSAEAQALTHAALEVEVQCRGREVLRQLMADHFALRAKEEVRLAQVVDAQGIPHTTHEEDHTRPLVTIFGAIPVSRVAYRHKGTTNLYPADLVANLPVERYSHGLREIAARAALQDSFDSAVGTIAQQTG